MILLEYVQSLQDQGLSQQEIFDKVQEWKKNNPQEENVEEVKEDVEVKQDDSQTQDPNRKMGLHSKQTLSFQNLEVIK